MQHVILPVRPVRQTRGEPEVARLALGDDAKVHIGPGAEVVEDARADRARHQLHALLTKDQAYFKCAPAQYTGHGGVTSLCQL